jgi:hypothetical protein
MQPQKQTGAALEGAKSASKKGEVELQLQEESQQLAGSSF